MSFQIGDKVVCVDDSIYECTDFPEYWSEWIRKGQTYCVQWVGPGYDETGTEHYCIDVVGIAGVYHGQLLTLESWRFRKLSDLKAESKERYYEQFPLRT